MRHYVDINMRILKIVTGNMKFDMLHWGTHYQGPHAEMAIKTLEFDLRSSNQCNQLSEISLNIKYGGIDVGIVHLLPTGSEEKEVLGAGSIPVALLLSCQENYCIIIA